MRTLAHELDIYPIDLLTNLPAGHENTERVWWVVYTRSRQEQAVARELHQYRIPFYLPQIPRNRVITGRQIRSFRPLFEGYVFVFGTDDELLMTLKTNRISRILPVADQDQICRDLSQVSRLIATDAPLRVERRLKPGQAARIKAGPLRDFEGTIFIRNGRQRFLVAVDFLKQGVSVEIEDAMLELR